MYQLVLIFHIIAAVAIIGLVLIQQGKGADIGAAFGSGASNTVFGSTGSGGFLFKLTGSMAAAFFATSLTLGYISSTQYKAANVVVPVSSVNKKVDDVIPMPVESESTTKEQKKTQ